MALPSTDMNRMRVIVFLGSTREGRMCTRVAKFVAERLEKRNYIVELFDPVVLKFPLLEKPMHFYEDSTQVPQWMQECATKIKESDAIVLLSTEYNSVIPPALSNMLCHFSPTLFTCKPSGIVTYSVGVAGGIRVTMQLRALLGDMGSLSIGNTCCIPEVNQALDENGIPQNDNVVRSAEKMISQLDWVAKGLKSHKGNFGSP